MASSYASGDRIDFTPGVAIAAGQVVVQGDVVAVADLDIPANTLGALSVRGAKKFPKASGGSTAIAVGVVVYWDAGNTRVTTSAGGGTNKRIGPLAKAAADGDTEVIALLGHPT